MGSVGTGTVTSFTSGFFIFNFEHILHLFSSVSIVELEQANVSRLLCFILMICSILQHYVAAEAYSEPSKTSKTELFVKIVNSWR